MKTLLEYREKMKLFLGKYDIYIFPVLKFALALIVFLSINGNVGFMSRLTNPGIALVLALMCSFLPLNVTAVFGALLILFIWIKVHNVRVRRAKKRLHRQMVMEMAMEELRREQEKKERGWRY